MWKCEANINHEDIQYLLDMGSICHSFEIVNCVINKMLIIKYDDELEDIYEDIFVFIFYVWNRHVCYLNHIYMYVSLHKINGKTI